MSNTGIIKKKLSTCRIKTHLTVVFCSLLVFYSGCSQPGHAGKLDLGFKPGQGKLFTMRISIEDTIIEGKPGQQAKTYHVKTTDLSFYVNGIDDNGIATIKATFRAIREKTDSPLGSIDYDYSNPLIRKEGPVAKIYNAMIGESFLFKVNAAGEIVDVDAEELFRTAADKIIKMLKSSGDANEAARIAKTEEIRQSMKNYPLTSAEYLKELTGLIIPAYPGRPVKIGDSWTARADTSKWTSYVPQTDGAYTLKQRKQGLAVVKVNAKKTITDGAIPESGVEATYSATLKIEGNLEINEETGVLVHKQIKAHLAGDLTDRGQTRPLQQLSAVTVVGVQ